jgi:hypothetical protein
MDFKKTVHGHAAEKRGLGTAAGAGGSVLRDPWPGQGLLRIYVGRTMTKVVRLPPTTPSQQASHTLCWSARDGRG